MPLRRAFFEVKQKAFATGEGKVFFLPLWAKPKSWEQQKNKQKKRKGLLLFFLFQVSKQRQTFFVFSFWSKLKKNKH